jgi:hypothetical protein
VEAAVVVQALLVLQTQRLLQLVVRVLIGNLLELFTLVAVVAAQITSRRVAQEVLEVAVMEAD